MRRLAVIGASRLATSVPDLGLATNIQRRESDWGLQLRCSVCSLAPAVRHHWDLWLLLQPSPTAVLGYDGGFDSLSMSPTRLRNCGPDAPRSLHTHERRWHQLPEGLGQAVQDAMWQPFCARRIEGSRKSHRR